MITKGCIVKTANQKSIIIFAKLDRTGSVEKKVVITTDNCLRSITMLDWIILCVFSEENGLRCIALSPEPGDTVVLLPILKILGSNGPDEWIR